MIFRDHIYLLWQYFREDIHWKDYHFPLVNNETFKQLWLKKYKRKQNIINHQSAVLVWYEIETFILLRNSADYLLFLDAYVERRRVASIWTEF